MGKKASLYGPDPPTIWMESIKAHTYDGVPQPVGSFYLAHDWQVENIEQTLKFARQVPAPPKAVRTSEPAKSESQPDVPVITPETLEPEPRTPEQPEHPAPDQENRAKVLTTEDMPTRRVRL